jgi:hypothetical protein
MPEEINRRVADHLAATLALTDVGGEFRNEGITHGVGAGDVMYAALQFAETASGEARCSPASAAPAPTRSRPRTGGEHRRLAPRTSSARSAACRRDQVVCFTLHAQARAGRVPGAARLRWWSGRFPDMLLEQNAPRRHRPGGAQKEAYFYGVPCVAARRGMAELVECGANVLAPPSDCRSIAALRARFRAGASPEIGRTSTGRGARPKGSPGFSRNALAERLPSQRP